jgi:hypothetical protein
VATAATVFSHADRAWCSGSSPDSRAAGWIGSSCFVTDLFLSFPFILGALAMAPIIVSHFAKPGQLGTLSKVQLSR